VLEVLGRADDLIITGGENVMPAEVEAELETHPQISRAVVFGQPDPEWGEIVAAVLVPDGSPVESAALREWCDERLAPYRRPRLIAWFETLPETATGKIDRNAVIAAAAGTLTDL
jgi:O-succinylbenzoic acid--CoA ligase